jgi:hypothetical protein
MSSDPHEHQHGPGCGHIVIRHDDHIDHLHDGELHHHDETGVERHALAISDSNPAACTPAHDCAEHDADHEPRTGLRPSPTASTPTTLSAATCTTHTAITATTTGPSRSFSTAEPPPLPRQPRSRARCSRV